MSVWAQRRLRAEELQARHPFVAEVLTLYLALLEVQEDAWRAACERQPHPHDVAEWAEARVLPRVVAATLAAGPAALRDAVRDRPTGADREALVGWLAGAELEPVDRYLARASLAPVLEALGERASAACAPAAGEVRCPRCGGTPQLSFLASSGDSLVAGGRSLLCARCASSWILSKSTCPSCGETEEGRLEVHAEKWAGPVSGNGNAKREGAGKPVFPQLRIAGCSTCHRYLIEVDMARDGRAVPEVDELAALPLDLYAADQGMQKVTPNLMGF